MFDSTAIVWYAAVCGALAAFAPRFGGRTVRIVTGAVVGIVAASVFPAIKGIMGY
ncbi:hypothetical protein [Ahrensia kielensis]|uniref:hypothetical protein n=1 Tax=Ahrensia kielensis TaxID=76980 RepID=UPI0003612890|nr:hypothetical protein [Ahrensia kielensis]